MVGLGIVFGLIALGVVLLFFFFAMRQKSAEMRPFFIPLAALLALTLSATVAIYARTGHFQQWQNARPDTSIDPRLAAKITEAKRAALQDPENPQKQIELIRFLLQGGLFKEAVQVADQALHFEYKNAELHGLKARSLYYRDGKQITPSVERAIEEALRINPYEAESCMLKAEDAFRRQDYALAIKEWQRLLDSGRVPFRENAIKNAIAQAKKRMQPQ